jgi:DNA-binding HxlR family transcriptional regulator
MSVDDHDHDHQPPSAFCPVYHRAIELIGRRWTGAILRVLLGGPTRFSEIAGAIPGLSDRLLSERLKELETEGIVQRTVYPETPVRIEYALTPMGHDLDHVIEAVSDWAATWLSPRAATLTDEVPCPEADVEVELRADAVLSRR